MNMEADNSSDDPPEGNAIEMKVEGVEEELRCVKQTVLKVPVRRCRKLPKNKTQTARKSFKKPPLKGSQSLQVAGVSGKILRFSCSECKGDTTFSPNDLSKHFQGVHQGSLPTFPCDMCSFVTSDFSSLQRHRIEHRDTFVICEICNDGIQYTLLQLTRHFNMYHSLNGYYRCEKCKFSTRDVGTFVQHTHRHNEPQYKCGKGQHVSYSRTEYHKNCLVHSSTFPYVCQLCDYATPRKEYFLKHMAAAHGEEKKQTWRPKERTATTLVNSLPRLKLRLTKSPSRESHWMSRKLHTLHDYQSNPEKTGDGPLQENSKVSSPQKTVERAVAPEKDCKTWVQTLKTEQQYVSHATPAFTQPMLETDISPTAGFTNSNSLTVLMVKNRISIPPNCTTKLMGFKMVDGKKHLVLKVVPSNQESKMGSCPPAATKETFCRTSVEGDGCLVSDTARTDSPTNCCSLDNSIRRTLPFSHVYKNCNAQAPSRKGSDVKELSSLLQTQEPRSSEELRCSTPLDTHSPVSHVNGSTSPDLITHTNTSLHNNVQKAPADYKCSLGDHHGDLASNGASKTALNSSSQEVFSFHNYSKDSSSFSDVSFTGDELMTDGCPLQRTLSLGSEELSQHVDLDEVMETEPESEIVVDECVATVEDEYASNVFYTATTNMSSVSHSTSLSEHKPTFLNCGSAETEVKNLNVTFPKKAAGNVRNGSDLGRILEQHSAAIISQQLEKERSGATVTQETDKSSPAMVRILQPRGMAEGQRQLYLQTGDSKYAVPIPLQATSGFKLLTSSSLTPINLSYMQPSGERLLSKKVSLPLTLDNHRIGATAQVAQSGSLVRQDHTEGNSRSVLVSSPTKSPKVPTCFLLQRPLPVPKPEDEPAGYANPNLSPGPVLAPPQDQATIKQACRQAFLLRYVCPVKSGCSLDNQGSAGKEQGSNRLLVKVLKNPSCLSQPSCNAIPTHEAEAQPVLLSSSGLKTPCLLMSSNQTLISVPSGLRSSIKNCLPTAGSVSKFNNKVKKLHLPVAKRKRAVRLLAGEGHEPPSKAKKQLSRRNRDMDTSLANPHWEPVSRQAQRTLRLRPFSTGQSVTCPRQNQPVVVLNHPDADLPEVSNLMKKVNKYRGDVLKVALSKRTLDALSEWECEAFRRDISARCHPSHSGRAHPQRSARERFILKLKLQKTSRTKYKVVSGGRRAEDRPVSVFSCWFCGRIFDNQEEWIGHGQRHLMEATRDWNQLFGSPQALYVSSQH